MKQRFLAALLAVAMLIMLWPAGVLAGVGDTFTAKCGDVDVLFKITGEPSGGTPGRVQVGDGTDPAILQTTAGPLLIPETVTDAATSQSYTVTAIGAYAFQDCEKVTKAIFPKVTHIGNSAFENCGLLASLSLPAEPPGVATAADPFKDCPATRSLTLVDENGDALTGTDLNKAIARYESASGFSEGKWRGWSLPAPPTEFTVNDVKYMVLREPSGGTPGTVQVGDGANEAIDENTTGSITIPETVTDAATSRSYTVTAIANHAFAYCRAITSITIPTSVTSIGEDAFNTCLALRSITGQNGVTTIGESAFNYCKILTTVSFPEATYIGIAAFQSCLELTEAIFPKVTYIESAFDRCSKLASLSLPAAPPYVRFTDAFDDCPADRSLTLVDANGDALTGQALDDAITAYKGHSGYKDTTGLWYGWKLPTPAPPPEFEVDGVKYKVLSDPVDTTPGKVEVTANQYTGTTYTIPASVISDGKVYDVTGIGNSAFYQCTNLSSITAPSVTSIGELAFWRCQSLTTVNFPAATLIDTKAFEYCSALTTASFLAAMSIGERAFYDCSKLETASFPAAKSIGDRAFGSCDVLDSLSLPGTPPTVTGGDAFVYCPSMRDLTLVKASGDVLTGTELNDAIAAYEQHAGYFGGLWYGWTLPEQASTHTITATAGDNGNITPSGAVAVAEGGDQTFTIAANAGYQIADVLVDGTSEGDVATYTFTNVTADHTIAATFEMLPAQQHTITLSASPATGGTVSGGGTFDANTSRTVTATPSDGYLFGRWTENGVEVNGSASYTFPLTAERNLVAVFEETSATTYTIALSASPAAGGTVSGGGTFNANTSRTVRATASDGYLFVRWTENGSEVSTGATYTFDLTADRTLVAVFKEKSTPGPTPPTPGGPTGYSGYTGSTYTGNEYPGSFAGNTLTVQGNCANLTSVMVDGVIRTQEVDYMVNCGSTVVTFTPAFLATLKDGQHTVKVQFTDGRYDGTFTTSLAGAASAPVVDVPATGGPMRTAAFLWFLCGACCLLARMVVDKRRKDSSSLRSSE